MTNIFTSNYIYSQIVMNFILGGFIIASVNYVATFTNPILRSILWTFPFSIIPVMYSMQENNKNNLYISKFLLSTTFAVGLLVLCTFLFSYYLKHSKENEGITPSILKATAWWMVFSILFYLFIMYGGYKKYFL